MNRNRKGQPVGQWPCLFSGKVLAMIDRRGSMSTSSSTPMPATGSLQLIETVTERFDGAPVGERRRLSDEFKEWAVAAALDPGVNVSALARRLGISPPQLFGWRKAFLKKRTQDVVPVAHVPLVEIML